MLAMPLFLFFSSLHLVQKFLCKCMLSKCSYNGWFVGASVFTAWKKRVRANEKYISLKTPLPFPWPLWCIYNHFLTALEQSTLPFFFFFSPSQIQFSTNGLIEIWLSSDASAGYTTERKQEAHLIYTWPANHSGALQLVEDNTQQPFRGGEVPWLNGAKWLCVGFCFFFKSCNVIIQSFKRATGIVVCYIFPPSILHFLLRSVIYFHSGHLALRYTKRPTNIRILSLRRKKTSTTPSS